MGQGWDERRLLLAGVDCGREVVSMPAYCSKCGEGHVTGDNKVCESRRKEGTVRVTTSARTAARMAAKSSKDGIKKNHQHNKCKD